MGDIRLGQYEIAIDIGGTFTDWVLWERGVGLRKTGKLLTTADIASGFLAALDAAKGELPSAQIGAVRHATTVATNALIQGQIPPLILFSTSGFRDVLEIGRQFRRKLYDLDQEKPRPLVPRDCRIDIDERIDSDGSVITPLDEDAVRRQAALSRARGYKDFAIAYLNSYANPEHEERTAELVLEEVPDARVSVSARLWRQYREFERASTCVVNAAVAPAVTAYLATVRRGLETRGILSPLLVMTSTGGLVPAEWIALRPVHIIESGPAAGAIAAAVIGAGLGAANIIALDMGGTSAKVALIERGTLRLVTRYAVGGPEHASDKGAGGGGGGGYPINLPSVDLVEVGAGGGSIARVDPGGRLLVGPHSAGASPGPACYGLGGTEPTVTDANLVLGRIQENRAFGLDLDLSMAAEAIKTRVGDPLGVSVRVAAEAIVTVANSRMFSAVRKATIERGRDARSHVLVTTGGGGPLHGCALAQDLGIRTVVVPPHSGVASAIGLLEAPLRWDAQVPVFVDSKDVSRGELARRYGDLASQVEGRLVQYGAPPADIQVSLHADVRYKGQSYELSVPVDSDGPGVVEQIVARFHEEHQRRYLHSSPGQPIEIVNLRASAISPRTAFSPGIEYESAFRAPTPAKPSAGIAHDARPREKGPKGSRLTDTPTAAAGPTVMQHSGSTVYVPGGWVGEPDGHGNLGLVRRTEGFEGLSPSQSHDHPDVATREVVKYGLESIAEHMAAVVESTARSTIIREILDYATALFDEKGRLVGQSSRLPFDHNSMSTTLATIVNRWKPLADWRQGDVVLANDPYLAGSQHLPDLQLFMPLFYGDLLVGVAGCVGHHVDVGGRVPGSYCLDATEIFEEGLRIPPVLLYRKGQPDDDIWALVLANVRLPDIVRGDLEAQVAALRVAEQGIAELIGRVGLQEVQSAQRDLLRYSEVMMRREIAKMPTGKFSFQDKVDNDGVTSDPFEIKVSITIGEGKMVVDFTGTAAQRAAPVNATLAMVLSSVYYVVMALADPTIPQNDGCFRCIRVIAPPGSVVNANSPAPVVGRVATCHRIVDTLFGALAQALPARIPAAFYGMSDTVSMSGIDEKTGQRWIFFEIGVGGWGGRPGSDGLDALSAHLHNIRNTPIEVMERTFPLRVERFELIPDSGGSGEFRGGLGTLREIRLQQGKARLTVQGDRFEIPPYGLHGGSPGRTGSFTIVRANGEVVKLPSKVSNVDLGPGDLLRVETQGGGGYGTPNNRMQALIDRDILEGKTSRDHAYEP